VCYCIKHKHQIGSALHPIGFPDRHKMLPESSVFD
jgi:hypothetical protein